MTELTFLDVFFPKAQMQAHSAGTVKLASDHWLSTYWPITGPTFPTRASLCEGRETHYAKENNSNVLIHLKEASLRWASVQFGVFQCKDVNSAFVTRGAQEGGVVAEVYTGEDITREKWQLLDKKREFKCFPCYFFSYFWPYM